VSGHNLKGKAQHERPMERSSLSCVRPQFGMYDDIAEETGYDRDALRHYKRVAENDNSLLRNNRWLFCCALLLCDGHIGKVPFSYLTTCRVLCSVLSIVDRTGK